VASRAAKVVCDEGLGVAPTGLAVFLDFEDAIMRYGRSEANVKNISNPSDAKVREAGVEAVVSAKYGNLFEMYEKITGDDPYVNTHEDLPGCSLYHGRLWVDYNLETQCARSICLGEANFSDHGANRLGASALMQGLADGYFVIPYTIGQFLSR
jgi:succinate dehydrogenase / fumarate reductase flavoprotein subunit